MRKKFKHSVANADFIKFLLSIIFCLLTVRGNALSTQKNKEASDDGLILINDLLYSECGINGDLFSCFQQICNAVSDEISPLNRPPDAVFRVHPIKNRVVFEGSEVTDPHIPGSKEASSILDNVENYKGRTADEVLRKFNEKGLTDEQKYFLRALAVIVSQGHLPNCGGMAAQVSGRLLAQPLIQKTQTEVFLLSLNAIGGTGQHTIVKTYKPNSPANFICDSWARENNKATFCIMDPNRKPSDQCAPYGPGFWKTKENYSAILQMPNLSNLKPKVRSQYRHEVRMLLTTLNERKKEAQEIYQKLNPPIPSKSPRAEL